jgi:hypothetical protein
MKKNIKTISNSTDGFCMMKFGGVRHRVLYRSVGFNDIAVWKENIRELEPVVLDLNAPKEKFFKQLERYPEIKENAERLKPSIAKYMQANHVLVQQNKDGRYVAYEGNSRSVAIRILREENPAEYQHINVGVVPKEVKLVDIMDYVNHIHLSGSFKPKPWKLLNRAKLWKERLENEGRKALKNIVLEEKQKAVEDGEKPSSPAHIQHHADAYTLFEEHKKKEKKLVTEEDLRNESASISHYLIFAEKQKNIPNLLSNNSKNQRKVFATIQAAKESGMGAFDLRKHVLKVKNLSVGAIRKAGKEKSLHKLFNSEEAPSRKDKDSEKRQPLERRDHLVGKLLKAKKFVHEGIGKLKTNQLDQKNRKAKDILIAIQTILNKFLED